MAPAKGNGGGDGLAASSLAKASISEKHKKCKLGKVCKKQFTQCQLAYH